MEKLIHQYLEENYFPYKEKDIYKIYLNDGIFDDITRESPIKIISDLKTIYGLEYEEVKLFVYLWGVKKYSDINLSEYWGEYDNWVTFLNDGTNKAGGYFSHAEGSGPQTDFSSITFPMVQRVMSRTIGLDMVSVRPMSAPKGILFYMDYKYGPKLTFKQKLNRVLDKIKIFIRKMEKDIRKYLHITNYNTTFVTQEQ